MASTLAPLALALAAVSAGGHDHHHHHGGGFILPPGPGYGWGFPNGAPDGYGWYGVGHMLPLGADRTPEYYFPRHFALPPGQMFLPSYYNPYEMRGQRYLPYAGCGGCHPAGGLPPAPSSTPMHPYAAELNAPSPAPVPTFSGRVEAPPVNLGTSGLTP